MAYVTQAQCYVCKAKYTKVNSQPWACPDCYPKERERLEKLEKAYKDVSSKFSALREKVNSLYPEIIHGDEKHQKWLAEKLITHFGEFYE